MLTLSVNADNLLRLDGVTVASTGEFVNDATVTFALKTESGVVVASGDMLFVIGSQGRYEGVLESTVELVNGESYFLETTVVSGNANGFWRDECVAYYQDGSD